MSNRRAYHRDLKGGCVTNRCGVSWLQACRCILCAVILCCPWMSNSDAAEVRNVVMRQVGDQVEVIYDLAGELGEREADVTVTLTIGGKRYEADRLTLKGDSGKKVRVGPGRRFAWDVLADLPAGFDGEIAWEVTALGSSVIVSPSGALLSTFTSPTLGGAFVLIPAGTFTMGSPADEPGRDNDETQHRVTIGRAFYMQTTEVTQGQWRRVMGNSPSYFKNCGDDCPVERVSWNDVQEFIRKLNSQEGTDKYRLPTEAEWEYAARAGTTTALYSGSINILGQNNAPALDAIAWYGGNSCADYAGGYDSSGWKEKQISCSRSGPHPVGKKRPNAWGLYDMLGNVWEWVQDWYGEYPSGSVTDPSGPSSGSFRVIRGGSWFGLAGLCRSASRYSDDPGPRNDLIGFRLARTK